MRVDRATLDDLSILDPDAEGLSLFALLDRTTSRAGQAILRKNMQAPFSSAADLRDAQDAVRHLMRDPETLFRIIGALDPDAVARYIDLKWEAATARSVLAQFGERLVLRLRYGDAVRQISAGVSSLRALLDGLPELGRHLAGGPSLLQGYAVELEDLRREGGLDDVQRYASAATLRDTLEADRLARGPARDVIRRCLALVAEADALCALAIATNEHEWCLPDVVDEAGVFDLRGLRHPFLPAGIANDLVVADRHRVVAVTGPNMAGKSTVLKAAGIAVYLAHLGCGIPATRGRLSRFDALMASLNVRDSLTTAQSFYLSEVRRIRDLVTLIEAVPRVFALLDEPFKGTNVHDATEATTLLLDGLCAQVASTVLVATHLAAVVRSRSHEPGLAAVFLRATEAASGPVFDYVLRDGVSDQRLGMVLLEREGVTSALAAAIHRRRHVPLA